MATRDSLKKIRKTCLRLANMAHDGNLQSVFSSLEIIWCMYNKILNLDQLKAKDKDRDYFLCSKGQATLGLLCVLAEKGVIQADDLENYGKFNSRISMQADRTKFEYGIEISAGSLGHGLPLAAGIAISKKIRQHAGTVYVLLGDGEMHEGSNWEACGFISYRDLNNVRLIIDDNESHNYMYDHGDLMKRLDSFGFMTKSCHGNDVESVQNAINEVMNSDRPVAIVAHTQRGYGSKTLMTKKEWFHKAPDDEELGYMIDEVDNFDPAEAIHYMLSD